MISLTIWPMILRSYDYDFFIASLPFFMKIILFLAIGTILFLTSCSYKPLDTVRFVDVQRYTGKWYEIAHLPTSFQKGCSCTTAEYSVINETTLGVKNTCKKGANWDVANGKAFVKDRQTNSKLTVQFFWPFKGKYWIIDLAEDYSYAVVAHPNRKYLWILSRTPQMERNTYNRILEEVKSKGFPVNNLIVTEQTCGN